MPATQGTESEPARYDVVIQSTSSVRAKKLVSFWGMTRALLQNAVEGVSEGHSLALRLVGVGYRAAVEADPTPRLSKLQAALQVPGARTFFTSKEQEEAYRLLAQREDAMQGGAGGTDKQQRLVLRLGYSHPISMPVPKGLTVATPQPTRIVVKGVDKEAVGLFASQIRAWRPPEPYKVSPALARAASDLRRDVRADFETFCLPLLFITTG
jgi:large subunit ribosomal protein L6